ncbi:ribosomal protein S18-alanine N-acetyltransferase [Streptococcus sp. S784/96/1]|uniref:ribosomal protein S18-alanine N-acetyltransferase n=1 Tax=Streptococcus sp. S784/96/1 TaxID=2653499 RepID=UPI0013895D9F|nr:ribosomal protein S18-alanine N-acetyltransferase [Streptococcus sp. S784/96/1]
MRDRASEIFEVLTDVYGTSPWNLEQIIADLEQENTDYFFEYTDGQLSGFLSIQNLVGELEITNIAVRKEYQGQGIAKRLMEQLDERSETVFLEVRESNLPAQALYQKYHFKMIGRRKEYYHNPIEDAILMRRERE